MDELKLEKRKNKGILRKTWERCKSFGNLQTKIKVPRSPTSSSTTSPSPSPTAMVKSKSWSSLFPPSPTAHTPPADKRAGSKNRMSHCVPHGCFSVYVGPNKQRFVIKVECTKHPLFKMLLEEAELEYGFHCDGPLVLPCRVDCFINVLLEMDGDDDTRGSHCQVGCRFHRSRSSYNLLSSPRLVALSQL